MLKKLKDQLRQLVKEPTPIDPSRFGDPHALQTEWTPLQSGGSNFRTHRLTGLNAGRAEFVPSPIARVFYGVFILLGAAIPTGIVLSQYFDSGSLSIGPGMLFPGLAGALFIGMGGFLMYRGTTPVVFDAARGLYWKGRRTPDQLSLQSGDNWARFSDIHALQLLSEHVRGNDSSYYSYELNLVLEDGRRLNVVDHGDATQLREDAQTLSQFIGKPIWDAAN